MDSVSDAILDAIRADGFSVGFHRHIDLRDGTLYHHVDASHPQTGERWSVNAPDSYTAAYELAVMLGWDMMDG